MAIIGRMNEKKILERLLDKPNSQFVAVYGRRRVGKTFLIRSVYEKHSVFDCTGLWQGTKEELLENFWINLSKRIKNPIKSSNTWLIAFNELEIYLDTLVRSKKKKVIFLDEISWFDTPKSGFISALSNFWNNYCTKRHDIILIVCGSAASWIIKKIVNTKGGLHNRLDRIIRLDVFTLHETKLFLESKKIKLSDQDILQLYMCLGGVPFYLNSIEPGRSVLQILNDLYFEPNAILSDEINILYAALFKNYENHLSVIKALNSKNSGLTRSEILTKTKLNSGGTLSQILEELESCGFIKKFGDIDKKVADGLYRLMDEYTIFYFKFIQGHKVKINAPDMIQSNAFKIWSGFAFENLCFRHLPQIARALGISGINYHAYSFIDKGAKESEGAQIDMIIDRADQCVNMVEMKYYNDRYVMNKQSHAQLTHRINSFVKKTRSKKSIFVTLISPHGAILNEHFLNIVTNEITMKDLMHE